MTSVLPRAITSINIQLVLCVSLVFALWLIVASVASAHQQRVNQSVKPLPLIQFTDIAPRPQFLYQTNNSYTGRKYFPQPVCGGVAIFYYDDDGRVDLFIAQVGRNALYHNNGGGTFTRVTEKSGLGEKPRDLLSVVAARVDYDNDGMLDLVVTNYTNWRPDTDIVCRMKDRGAHWLMAELDGTKSNRGGLGAKIRVTTATGRTLYNRAPTGVGYGSSSDVRVHFGLGASETAERIEINWPSGLARTLTRVKADQRLTVRETEEKQAPP